MQLYVESLLFTFPKNVKGLDVFAVCLGSQKHEKDIPEIRDFHACQMS